MTAINPADCGTCGEIDDVEGECPGSKRPCGHHCNCVWTHGECDWCNAHTNDDGELVDAISEQTVCRRIINGARCGGDMVRTGMSQSQAASFRPDPNGHWFYNTRCERCGRVFDLPVPSGDDA